MNQAELVNAFTSVEITGGDQPRQSNATSRGRGTQIRDHIGHRPRDGWTPSKTFEIADRAVNRRIRTEYSPTDRSQLRAPPTSRFGLGRLRSGHVVLRHFRIGQEPGDQ